MHDHEPATRYVLSHARSDKLAVSITKRVVSAAVTRPGPRGRRRRVASRAAGRRVAGVGGGHRREGHVVIEVGQVLRNLDVHALDDIATLLDDCEDKVPAAGAAAGAAAEREREESLRKKAVRQEDETTARNLDLDTGISRAAA